MFELFVIPVRALICKAPRRRRPAFYSGFVSKRLPADKRRAQLLDAAIRITEEQGLGALTIRAVAERAGVSLGVVHYCFVDKDELVDNVIGAANEELAAATRAFLNLDLSSGETGPAALEELVHEALNLQWRVISSSPDRQLLTYEIAAYSIRLRPPEKDNLALDQYRGYDELVEMVLRRAGESSQMDWDDFPAIVRATGAILDGAVLRWLIDRDDDSFTRSMEIGIKAVVDSARPAAE